MADQKEECQRHLLRRADGVVVRGAHRRRPFTPYEVGQRERYRQRTLLQDAARPAGQQLATSYKILINYMKKKINIYKTKYT
jgi:hypothetical protein